MIVKVFVGRIEGGDRDINDFHLPDSSVSTTWLDQDGRHRLYGYDFTVEFDLSFTFQHEINLCHLLMVMGAGLFGNLDQVNTGDRVFGNAESTP